MSKSPIVIVPWDFSDHAKAALKYTFQHYASDGIRVICILERPSPYGPGLNWGPEIERKAIESCVEDFFQTVDEGHSTGLQFFAEFGDPSDEIVRFANRNEADLIVMSTHGRTGLNQIIMGSVAQKVAAKTACPIMLLSNKWFEHANANATETAATSV